LDNQLLESLAASKNPRTRSIAEREEARGTEIVNFGQKSMVCDSFSFVMSQKERYNKEFLRHLFATKFRKTVAKREIG
jgi:hypothetical protein